MPAEVQYREAAGFPGYRVGDDGSVWSRWKMRSAGYRMGNKGYQSDRWKKLKLIINGDGYCVVNLRKADGGVCRSLKVHRLVLIAFGYLRPTEAHQVCHWNGDKTDNHLVNLRWGTAQENAADKVRHGRSGGCREEVVAAFHDLKIGTVSLRIKANGWCSIKIQVSGQISLDGGRVIDIERELPLGERMQQADLEYPPPGVQN